MDSRAGAIHRIYNVPVLLPFKKQSVVALTSCKNMCISCIRTLQLALWLYCLFAIMHLIDTDPRILFYMDISSAVKLDQRKSKLAYAITLTSINSILFTMYTSLLSRYSAHQGKAHKWIL